MKILLNIACGTQPQNLIAFYNNFSKENSADAERYMVHNLDSDRKLAELKTKGGASVIVADASSALPFKDGSVDVVLAVSPYGFSIVNEEVSRVLRPGGGIIILGSRKNKFVKGHASNSPDTLEKLREVKDGEDAELGRIAAYIGTNYVSFTTGGVSETKLDTTRMWRKR